MKIRLWLRVLTVNVLIFAALGGMLEVAARLVFPEFQGHIHSSSKTLGISHYSADFKGYPIRVPRPDYRPATDRHLFVVLGDSVSNGYGMTYEDIYWVRLQRLAQMKYGKQAPEFLALTGYGNNLADSAAAIDALTRDKGLTIDYILYQFNFNDITPYTRAALHANTGEGIVQQDLFRKLAVWRYEYLNYSVFFRMVQHYGGMWARKLSGSCEERELDALGPYTWTYGSRRYRDESVTYWREFDSKLADVKRIADKVGARFSIFVSPLVFDVDRAGVHPYFNHTRLDFSCATIEPRARLAQIARRLDIPMLDPAEFLRTEFEARLAENNFTPFFFTADENHFNQTAAAYIGEYLEPRIFGANAAPGSPAPRLKH